MASEKREEGDVGESLAVKRAYYKKPGKRMIISIIEGNYKSTRSNRLTKKVNQCGFRRRGTYCKEKKKEEDNGEAYLVRRVYYRKPDQRMIVSSIEGSYIKIVHLTN